MTTTENRAATLALIGSVLFENSLIHNVTDVQPEHIHDRTAATIWGAMLALSDRGVPINVLSIEDEVPGRVQDRARAVCAEAVNQTPVVGNAEQYVDAILDAYERRQGLVAAQELANAAHDRDRDFATVKAEVAGRLLRSDQRAEEYTADELAALDIAQVEAWAADPMRGDEVRGIPTGLVDLDKLLDGLWPGLFVLAARTSIGKTAFGTQLTTNVSEHAPVYYVGLEHQPVVYWRRMVGQMSTIPYKHVKRGLSKTELAKWRETGDTLRSRRLKLYNGSRKLGMVTAAINRAYHQWGELGLVVVDNIGHIRTGDDRAYEELGTVTLALLELSQRLRCTILGLHQINRSVEHREDKRPQMSDLRDSGYIEENADYVGLLYRDDYYNPQTEKPNILELAVTKNREDGATGIVEFYFTKQTGRIASVRTQPY